MSPENEFEGPPEGHQHKEWQETWCNPCKSKGNARQGYGEGQQGQQGQRQGNGQRQRQREDQGMRVQELHDSHAVVFCCLWDTWHFMQPYKKVAFMH